MSLLQRAALAEENERLRLRNEALETELARLYAERTPADGPACPPSCDRAHVTIPAPRRRSDGGDRVRAAYRDSEAGR